MTEAQRTICLSKAKLVPTKAREIFLKHILIQSQTARKPAVHPAHRLHPKPQWALGSPKITYPHPVPEFQVLPDVVSDPCLLHAVHAFPVLCLYLCHCICRMPLYHSLRLNYHFSPRVPSLCSPPNLCTCFLHPYHSFSRCWIARPISSFREKVS